MSRAFVREPDGDRPEPLPARPLSPHPNRVTARGLAQLRARLADAERRHAQADAAGQRVLRQDIDWLRARLASAVPVPVPADRRRVGFGATVLVDDGSETRRYRIVGEDEAAPDAGLISWVSPLARALEGAGVGDIVIWPRPAGDLEVEVREIRYEPDPAP